MILVAMLSTSLDVTYLVDLLELGAIHRPSQTIALAGGKGLNLARAAGTIGGRVTVVAPVGGFTGARVAALAADEGITLRSIGVERETRQCVSIVDPIGITEVYEPSAVPEADLAVQLTSALAAEPAASWTAVAGSVPPGFPVEELVAGLLARRSRGDRIAIDTHGPALRQLVDLVQPELVKVNRAEASGVLGIEGSAASLARALQARTGGIAVVTDGVDGSVAVDAGGAWRALPDPDPGRYSVGSGDSYFAGLLCALDAGASLREALALAAAAGAANTRQPGAGWFSDDALAQAVARLSVEPIA